MCDQVTHTLLNFLLYVHSKHQGPVVQSIVSLTTSLMLTIWYLQHICDIYFQNFNETLTNDVVNFEQLSPGLSVILNHFSLAGLIIYEAVDQYTVFNKPFILSLVNDNSRNGACP